MYDEGDQLTLFDPESLFSRTCRESSVQTAVATSKKSSRNLSDSPSRMRPMCLCLIRDDGHGPDASMTWTENSPLLGGFMTRSFGESPNVENVCLLSSILEDSPLPKYSSTAVACAGILRRIRKKGRPVPPELMEVLERQSHSKNEPENRGGGKGILVQNEKVCSLRTEQNQFVYAIEGNGFRPSHHGCGISKEVAPTLNRVKRHAVCIGEGQANMYTHIADEHSNTLNTLNAKMLIVDTVTTCYRALHHDDYIEDGSTSSLLTHSWTGGGSNDLVVNHTTNVVRKLTPLECERLQGFPDFYTDIGEWTDSKGRVRSSSDALRWKALGNSIAVGYANNRSGFWCWLMRRIAAQYERQAALGSLFDGIGGFPLAWEAAGGRAVWASEIDEFCIAVTTRRFPEKAVEG